MTLKTAQLFSLLVLLLTACTDDLPPGDASRATSGGPEGETARMVERLAQIAAGIDRQQR